MWHGLVVVQLQVGQNFKDPQDLKKHGLPPNHKFWDMMGHEMLIFVIFWELSIYPNIFQVLLVQFIPSIGRVQSPVPFSWIWGIGRYNSLQTTTESWFELSLAFLRHQKVFDGLEVGNAPVHFWHRLMRTLVGPLHENTRGPWLHWWSYLLKKMF